MSPSDGRSVPRYLPVDRRQVRLEPLDVDRLVDEDHSARKIWRVVEKLDLARFESAVRAVEGRAGRRAHSPQVLVSVWIYAFSRGLHSAREIARQIEHEPGLRWLSALRPINHHTLSDFRVAHGEALRELLVQVLAMLVKNRLVTLERVAADGTKIRADASRKSFRRRDAVRAHLAVARRHVEELERQERDEQTTRRQQAARERAVRESEQRIEDVLAEIERLQTEKKTDKKKEPQASTSDSTARFMRNGDGGLAPAYNVQFTADSAHGLIVDVEAIDDPQDAAQLAPAMDRLREAFGSYPHQALADGGYRNHPAVVALAERKIDFYGVMTGRSDAVSGVAGGRHPDYRFDRFGYQRSANEMICPQGKRLSFRAERALPGGRRLFQWTARTSDCGPCPAREQCCPKLAHGKRGRSVSLQLSHPAVDAFDENMRTKQAQTIYRERAPLIEFPNDWIKTKLGLRRFAAHGLNKVRCEALWAALTFNLQGAFRLAPDFT